MQRLLAAAGLTLLLLLLAPAASAAPFLVLVQSQPTPLEAALAQVLKEAFIDAGLPGTHLLLQHELPQPAGFWTYLPALHYTKKVKVDYDWLALLSPHSNATLASLTDAVADYQATDRLYLGTGMTDGPDLHSIRHHYQRKDYPYPLAGHDLVFSRALVRAVRKDIRRGGPPSPQFHIDAEWELAAYLHDVHGVDLTPMPGCPEADAQRPTAASLAATLRRPVSALDLAVGVKTAELYHDTRVPEVLATWADDVPHLHFYSTAPHPMVPTVWEGIPDTKSGHCGKTMALLRDLHRRYTLPQVAWFVVADDDTLLSVPRLLDALSLLDPDTPVFAGERYGYGHPRASGGPSPGYDYLTGGAAMVFSRAALGQLLGCAACRCRTDEAPDDMALGIFMQELGVPAIHVPGMHQAAPAHYHPLLLAAQAHISFHSCRAEWQCDFRDVYRRYLTVAPAQ
eukprot:EG_transcript_10367